MPGAVPVCDLAGRGTFVDAVGGEPNRIGLNCGRGLFGEQRHHQAGVDTARQKCADGNVAPLAQPDRISQQLEEPLACRASFDGRRCVIGLPIARALSPGTREAHGVAGRHLGDGTQERSGRAHVPELQIFRDDVRIHIAPDPGQRQ